MRIVTSAFVAKVMGRTVGTLFIVAGAAKLIAGISGETLRNTLVGRVVGSGSTSIIVLGGVEVLFGACLILGLLGKAVPFIGLSFSSLSIAMVAAELVTKAPAPCGCFSLPRSIQEGNERPLLWCSFAVGVALLLAFGYLFICATRGLTVTQPGHPHCSGIEG